MYLKDLIKSIHLVSPEAAKWVEESAHTMPTYGCNGDKDDDNSLDNLFTWGDSPQGKGYWEDIFEKLNTTEEI